MLDCVACNEKRNNSYIILYTFTQFYLINCPALVDIKQT